MGALTYSDAGVNRQVADRFVEKIGALSKSTLNRKVKTAIGGYASLYELDSKRWIAASTDGVGTKLKLAFQLNDHRTVGIDLVAMSVNDLLCVGAEPLFFLDYFATGRLNPKVGEQVIQGIVEGCRLAQCALVGGETAEMPDFYQAGEYDLAGFSVGFLSPSQALPKKDIKPGDVLIGIASSGCHSNGYSLIRKAIGATPRYKKDQALLKEFLTPTRIYTKALLPLIRAKAFKGLAHITGSGFLNVPRMSDQVSYEIHLPPVAERPLIFKWLKSALRLPLEELAQTFNMGLGMIAVVPKQKANLTLKKLRASGEKAWIVGQVIPRKRRNTSQVILHDEENSVTLGY